MSVTLWQWISAGSVFCQNAPGAYPGVCDEGQKEHVESPCAALPGCSSSGRERQCLLRVGFLPFLHCSAMLGHLGGMGLLICITSGYLQTHWPVANRTASDSPVTVTVQSHFLSRGLVTLKPLTPVSNFKNNSLWVWKPIFLFLFQWIGNS